MESQFTNITEYTANIKGSKGDIYSINFIEQTCTCADFVYRKSKSPINSDNRLCKHLRQWFNTHEKPKESILKVSKSAKARHQRSFVETYVNYIHETFKLFPEIKKYDFCGSYRRGAITIGDLDIIMCLNSSNDNIDTLFNYLEFNEFRKLWRGPQKASYEINGLQIDFRVIPEECWAFSLLHYTGSKKSNIRLRAKASKLGYSLSEYGFNNQTFAIQTEEAIFDFLNEPYVKPENRV